MKPKTLKQKNSFRKIRTAKSSTAKEAIGIIEKNTDTFILTFGQFSIIDALVVILDQIGSADVTISTWTAADAHLQRTLQLIESADIRSLRLIVDRSFEGRQPEYSHHMRTLFGGDCIRAIRTHAKFMLIRNDNYDIVIRTSMNLNENPRLENIEISESLHFAEYFQELTDSIFAEVGEGENRSSQLSLPGIPDEYPFKEVQAKQIKRSALNEPETSHTIKKL